MPLVTRANAAAAAVVIRDEVANRANTALRVGGAMLDQVDSTLFNNEALDVDAIGGTAHKLRVAGVVEYEFDANAADLKSNSLISSGNATLSGAGSYVAVGLNPATVGALRLAGDSGIWFNASGDNRRALLLESGGDLILGASGVGGVANARYDVDPGGVHTFRIDGAVEAELSGSAFDLQDNDLVTTGSLTVGFFQIDKAVAQTTAAGLVLRNPTAAGGGTHQYSPALVLQGESFSVGSRFETYARTQLRTTTGAIVPTLAMSLGSAAEGTAADAASLTDALTLTPTQLALPGSLSAATYVAVGASPAAFGGIRVGVNDGLIGRSDVLASDMPLIVGYAGGHVQVGSSAAASLVSIAFVPGGDLTIYEGATPQLVVNGTTADFQNNNIVTTGVVSIGVSPATIGGLRLTNGDGLYGDDGSGNNRRLIAGFNGDVFVGEHVGGTSPPNLNLMALMAVNVFVAGGQQLVISDTTIDAQNNNFTTTGSVTSAIFRLSVTTPPTGTSTEGKIYMDAAGELFYRSPAGNITSLGVA